MLYKKTRFIIVILFGFGLTGLNAQEAIPATGGEASGGGGSVSYTIGQVLYTLDTGTNGSVLKGVQQPYEISVISGFEQVEGIDLLCKVYPNPVADRLVMKVRDLEFKDLYYKLFDMNGKLIATGKIIRDESTINLHSFAASTYFLRVVQKDQTIKTFKIIKAH